MILGLAFFMFVVVMMVVMVAVVVLALVSFGNCAELRLLWLLLLR